MKKSTKLITSGVVCLLPFVLLLSWAIVMLVKEYPEVAFTLCTIGLACYGFVNLVDGLSKKDYGD